MLCNRTLVNITVEVAVIGESLTCSDVWPMVPRLASLLSTYLDWSLPEWAIRMISLYPACMHHHLHDTYMGRKVAEYLMTELWSTSRNGSRASFAQAC